MGKSLSHSAKTLHSFKNDMGRSELSEWNASRITVYNSNASVPDGEVFWRNVTFLPLFMWFSVSDGHSQSGYLTRWISYLS